VTKRLAPGVRLHVLRTDRFTTTLCRVALHRDLGAEATATAILGQVLQSGTTRHPSREAVAHRLADLYGASLHVGVEKLGDRQLLAASLEWPTAFVPRPARVLAEGLEFLREVWTDPKRGAEGALDPDIVRTEQVNHVRNLRALKDDKARYALRACIEKACEGEPFGLDGEGREEDVPGATPAVLAALHRRLLSTAPVEIFLVGDLGLEEAAEAVRKRLLWPGRASRIAEPPPPVSVRAARSRPRRLVETDQVVQGKLVLAYRAPVEPTSPLMPAAQTLAGVLGGGPYARLFKVVREVHGLCYYASASWSTAKGLMLIQSGVEPKNEPRATRLIRQLAAEVGRGVLDRKALEGYREAMTHRVKSLADSRGGAVGWYQEALALGIDPSPRRWLDALRRVTPAAVRRVGKSLGLDTTFFLGPPAGAATPAKAAATTGAS
jgi:predicted Zn-dependent peptidase